MFQLGAGGTSKKKKEKEKEKMGVGRRAKRIREDWLER